MWSASSLLKSIGKYAPLLADGLSKIEKSIGTSVEESTLLEVYSQAENISIDYAVSEKADNLLLVPANFFWSDVGDWQMVYDMKEKDKDGNSCETFGDTGSQIIIGTKNCLIQTENRLVATVGVSDLIIIETDDAVLITTTKESQNVKKVVEQLKALEKKKYL